MTAEISRFVEQNRENIIRDIKRLVNIRSVKEPPAADAPYGAGVRACQLEAMALCREIGLEVTDCGGHIAFGHYGRQDSFLGIIGHIDVVPEGSGWDTPPYECTERDGCLVGRGASDNKGPFVTTAYAIKYLIENRVDLRYGLRFFIGLDEESGMRDVEYYKARYPQPVFTMTPDFHYPVGHGEKGIYTADLVSPPMHGGVILEISGGIVTNAVPDYARALLAPQAAGKLTAVREGIRVRPCAEGVEVEAFGRAAHAAMPQKGISAIHLLADYLCESGALAGQEHAALDFIRRASASYAGELFGLDHSDGLFADTTLVCGMLRQREGRLALNVNCRYNTALPADEVARRIAQTAAQQGFSAENMTNSPACYLDPGHPGVQALCAVYAEETGQQARPILLSGGTYARCMDNAVSYGATFPDAVKPAWAGNGHMKNEAYDIERGLRSCALYIKSLLRLQEIEF